MTNDLYNIKELMAGMAELGAATVLKTLQPKTDSLTQRQAWDKFDKVWVAECVRKDLIQGRRKGPAKNSPIYYSKLELLTLKQAYKASRLGTFDNTKI